jgi:hypothetical protein
MDGSLLSCVESCKLENVEGDVLAKFADGSPAVIRHRYFKGEVIYSPSLVGSAGAGGAWKDSMFEINFPEACRAYYANIASMLSDPIASVFGARSPSDVRLHLLVANQTQLLLITNWSADPQDFQVRLRFGAGVAADLRAGKPLSVSGGPGQTSLQVHMGGHDWAAIALAPAPAALQAGMSNPGASFVLGPSQKSYSSP